MATKWNYIIGLAALVIAMIGLAELLLSGDLITAIFAESAELPIRREEAQLLYRQTVAFPLGPVVMAATPFQLAYVVLSICLTCLATLVCLINCLFFRRYISPQSKSISSQLQN